VIDLDALKARLAEYDDARPRCQGKVARTINCAPDWLPFDDPTYWDYVITTYSPCCRPEGHADACRNSRVILGWPGFVTMSALVAEVEHLREENADLRMQRDEHLIDNGNAYDEGYDAGTRRGYEAERAAAVAWLRESSEGLAPLSAEGSSTLRGAANEIERGEHRCDQNKETP